MLVNHEELAKLETKIRDYSVIKGHPKASILVAKSTPRGEMPPIFSDKDGNTEGDVSMTRLQKVDRIIDEKGRIAELASHQVIMAANPGKFLSSKRMNMIEKRNRTS